MADRKGPEPPDYAIGSWPAAEGDAIQAGPKRQSERAAERQPFARRNSEEGD